MRINVIIGAFSSLPPAPAGAIEKVWAQLAASFAASIAALNASGTKRPYSSRIMRP